MGKYAVEVEASKAKDFKIPGARIIEQKEIEENGTVGFIVESEKDIKLVGGQDGIVAIEPL